MSVYQSPVNRYAKRWELTSLIAGRLADVLPASICLWNLHDETGKQRVWFGPRRLSCMNASGDAPACDVCAQALRENVTLGTDILAASHCGSDGVYFLGFPQSPGTVKDALCILLLVPPSISASQLEGAQALLADMHLQDDRLRALRGSWARSIEHLNLAIGLLGKIGLTARKPRDHYAASVTSEIARELVKSIAEETSFGECCLFLGQHEGGHKPLLICARDDGADSCAMLDRTGERKWLSLGDCPRPCQAHMQRKGYASVCVIPLSHPADGPMGSLAAFSKMPFVGNRRLNDSDVDTVELIAATGVGLIATALYRQERELNLLKDRFLSSVTHELRQPLNSAKGFADMLLDPTFGADRLTDRQKKYVSAINDNARTAYELVNQLLSLARVDAGMSPVLPESIRASEQIRQLQFNEFKPKMDEKGLTFGLDLSEEKADIWVDPGDFDVIMRNLIGNAVKFTPQGGAITVAVRSDPSAGASVTVEDTGPGISLTERELIFDRFYQIKGKSGGGATGVGIGLALVKQLVERHAGRVHAEGRPGQGAIFVIEIPPKPQERGQQVNGNSQSSKAVSG